MHLRRLGLAWLFFVAMAAAAHAQGPQVVFTFDDLPAHGPLPPGMTRPMPVKSILATLKAEKMPPVYGFANGYRVAQYPYQIEILDAWRAAGEPIGSHTWSHPELDLMTAQGYIDDIKQNEPLLKRVHPVGDWHWFRYPFLEEGNTLAKRDAVRSWLFRNGYHVAEISLDFQDYNWNDAYARCALKHDERAIKDLHDTYLQAASEASKAFRQLSHTLYGRDIPYILLMHVGAFDAKMLPELIQQFRSEGYSFIKLEQAEADDAYQFDPHVTTKGGSTFMEQVAAARKVTVPELPDFTDELNKACRESKESGKVKE
ncbi:polysaccharide deacetylase family protein [Granulicella cerasi]|uniref:Polysaccharide deacetylase family protein n=1 Tax=Granulicella cerasi TaxID=741063 RepID=A0ABW1ZBY6_9BACT|nr:polysaccharide deacetylase family protein [Granulicella cerasi]